VVAGLMGHEVRYRYQPTSYLIGKTGTTLTRLAPKGQIRVAGEIWQAVSETSPVPAGRIVLIVAFEGLTLKVEALPSGLKD
jgi:membrane-bound ClpP family serine protease